MDKHPVELAASLLGSQVALAAALGVTKAAVNQWTDKGRRVPAEHCPAIERLTGGAVLCEGLRPDVRWQRFPDPAWPHSDGRPCIDVAAPELAA